MVVGSGFSGAVVAGELARRYGIAVRVIERREHVAGNAHTEQDQASGIMRHVYGPHIFHSDNARVWDYVQRYARFYPYVHRVKAHSRSGIYSLPVNLHTINQFFNRRFDVAAAQAFVASRCEQFATIANFEQLALSQLGRELYEEFIYGYTKKQWGVEPSSLPADIFRRLPLRFDYDDSYHQRGRVALPYEGYTVMVQRILDHPLIEVRTGENFSADMLAHYRKVVYTGAIDELFGHCFGALSYRRMSWETQRVQGSLQGLSQMNYTGMEHAHTRIIEHKYFDWNPARFDQSVYDVEFSHEAEIGQCGHYPKRLAGDMQLLQQYRQLAQANADLHLLGRLATYRYMDMEQVIAEALDFVDNFRF